MLHMNRDSPEIMKVLASVISFEFPERHVKDFLYSSKIYYDSEGSVTVPG